MKPCKTLGLEFSGQVRTQRTILSPCEPTCLWSGGAWAEVEMLCFLGWGLAGES